MAWGVGTTKDDAQAYEVGLETDVAEADVDSTSFYLDDAVGPTMEFDAPAWYGEDETYGTQSDWLTGEGLTSAWGPDQDKIQSTYSNPISEYVGESPVANLLVDARGMLRRGGQPSGWDIANLGLSVVPGLGPAAVSAAKPLVAAAKKALDGWANRKMAKQYMDEMLRDPDRSEEFAARVLDWLNDPRTDFDLAPSYGTGLPQNVTQLPGTKDIREMTWREWDDLSDSPFTLSSKQNGMMRAQGITDPDVVLDHFWGQGARQDFMGWVEESIAKTKGDFSEELEFVRYRDLKSGYIDEMTPAQLSNDLAWKGTNVPGSIDHLAVAEKMSWRPDSISHQDWAQFTKDMTMKEVERAARKLALRIVD